MVCLGNICRSPTAEAVLKAKVAKLRVNIEVDSAGTIGYHAGNPPDSRSQATGQKRGYNFKGMQSRKVIADDFEYYDLILAADKSNLADLKTACPEHLQYKLSLFLSHSDNDIDEIPDPYYGGDNGFEQVLDLIEDASDALLDALKS